MRIDLRGRTALVTGSTAGIGAAIALGLALAGAEVVEAHHRVHEADLRRRLEALAVPVEGAELNLGVELTVSSERLRAVISEIGAAALDPVPDLDGSSPSADADDDALLEDFDESGRGLSMIRALVTTVTVERQGDTNVWVLSRDSTGS